ncbi:MAG: hypothetical protein M1821_005584 [Bathelium mastoideum]|nr:MAG: hypothetical protein M1821_005584 [Bathelium mastoideum]
MKSIFLQALLLPEAVLSASLHRRQSSSNTAVVDLSVNKGTPQHLASGFIYGIPDSPANPSQIPSTFFSDIGFNYGRAGGAQLNAPCRGWIWGLSEYQCRFQSTLSNYKTTRQHGGNFILLPHDIWGTDHANSSTIWPGDSGSWTDYDKFVSQLISDILANDMETGLVWDVWNEADGSFWKRSQQQWIDLYVRTHKQIRYVMAFIPDVKLTVRDSSTSAMAPTLISGPSHAGAPTPSNTWWTKWLTQIKGNSTIPDQYSWHLEGSISDVNDDLQTNNATFASMLTSAGLSQPKQVNINEYATFPEQVAAGAAWWISRLERYNAIGLRGNWLSGYELHDLMASLISKPNADSSSYSYTGTGYYPVGEWQVYKYYNQNMTGHRAGTTGSGDRVLDVYATVGSDQVRVLTGVRLATGTWYITINKLSAVGLPTSGSLNIHTWGFVDKGHYGEVDAPTDRGTVAHTYSGDSVTFAVYQTSQDEYTAWAFEFAV